MKTQVRQARRTQIDYNAAIEEFTREDLMADEETTVILTKNNYIKRLPTSAYRAQERGGKGIIAIELKEGDFAKSVAPCMLKDYLLLVSNKGRAYWLKAYMVPQEGRYGMGKAIVNLVKIAEGRAHTQHNKHQIFLRQIPHVHNDKRQDKARGGRALLKTKGKRHNCDTSACRGRACRRMPVFRCRRAFHSDQARKVAEVQGIRLEADGPHSARSDRHDAFSRKTLW